jgi:hypothetical protein
MNEFPRWPVTYHEEGTVLWQDDGPPPPLSIGSGVIWHSGEKRFRVVDLWVSYDHHGHFDIGTHVFLEDVSDTEDDYPRRLAPSYFES